MAGVDEDGNRSRQAYEALLQRDGTNRVRGYLLIDAIGLKENLVPSEEDIEAALAERAAQEGRKPIAIRAALERQRRWNDFVESVRFDKVRKYLLDQTTINWTEYVEPVAEESGDDAAAESSKA
jgi:FKBP-type peptidyl-prolyl cis-trans isomerase (trigger factor)